ncbi:expressed unknown protein [Seminavis robusta]|uniref:Uncharacterized protein n=1 Tax=Seminavis robusta TaxID=568900 RepID=A0A9N8EGH6_9STRA|nr:expressed unknown protein [Seminavis robusta]|eukprot:Sro966_g225670.1 n/a (566) ;mRNA; f:9309-11006
MERQSSNLSPKPSRSPGSFSHPGSVPTSPIARRRKSNNKSGAAIFVFLRALSILGPLGFLGNIVYFQFYFPYNDQEGNSELVHGFSISFKGGLQRVHSYIDPHGRKMTGRDDITDDFTENNNNLPEVLSGTAVLHRLQKQAAFSWKECGSSSRATVALAKQLSGNQGQLRATSETLLEPFELKDTLLQLQTGKRRRLQEANNTSSSNGGIEQCQVPQPGSLECQESTYAMIVTFQGECNFRQLFMNLLAFLTFPSVSDIIVLMPHDDWGFEEHSTVDVKYKERLKAWHNDKQHKVWMIGLPQTLTDEGKYSFDFIVHKVMVRLGSAKAILFMDGSTLWNGNLRGIHAGFELWKQHPHALVAAAAAPSKQEDCPQGSSSSSWAAFCQSSSSPIPNEMNKLHHQYQNVLDMNGVFVHRDLLCLLRQPPLSTILIQSVWRVLDDYRSDQSTSAYIRAIMATTLLQLSGPKPPLLFPPRIARPKNETKDYNDYWHYMAPLKEREWLEALRANNTQTQDQVLVELLGYFGTGLSTTIGHHHAPYWCSSGQTEKGVYFMSDMAWIGPNSRC